MAIKSPHKNINNTKSINESIRSYIKVFPSAGIDPASQFQYQILDGNCYLDKRNPNNLIVYPFNYIFTPQFQNNKLINHMNLVNDAFEGKNQYMVAQLQKQNIMNLLLGNSSQPGFIIELADLLYYQTCYHGLKTNKYLNKKSQGSEQFKRQTKQKLGISVFAAQNCTNNFHDLIMGHKISYFSKKDMDQYKNFYTHQIDSMRQFFIVLKIALIHYRQRCREGDPLTFRFSIQSFDELSQTNYSSTLHVIFVQRNSKIANHMVKKIENSLSNVQKKGEDHGSIANYFEKDMRNSKLVYLYGIPFRNGIMNESVDRFNFLGSIRQHSYTITYNFEQQKHKQKIYQINKYRISRYNLGTNSLSYKQINIIVGLLSKLQAFMNETAQKWKNYCTTINYIEKVQSQFYEKQKFPVSLQIKDDSLKNFLISKVYKLSENYLIEDLSIQFEKLRTLKNQIILSLRSLMNPKQLNQNSKSIKKIGTKDKSDKIDELIQNSSSRYNKNAQKRDFEGSKYLNNFIKFYYDVIEDFHKILKTLFNSSFTQLKFQKIDLSKDVDLQIFDTLAIKLSMEKIKKQVKKIHGNQKQKDQIMLRKIRIRQENQHFVQINPFAKTNSFEQFQKLQNIKNINKNSILKKSNISNRLANTLQLYNNSSLVSSPPHIKHIKSIHACLNQINQNDSPQYDQQNKQKNKYNFSLPKIAVIHQKKKKLI